MPTLASLDFNNLYCLFKGEPGLRKSTCALSFPKPQYWFSFDQKMEALGLPMREWKINPEEVTFDDYSQWQPALAKLKSFQTKCPYRTIVIDSITSCADMINRGTKMDKQGTKTKEGGEKGITIAGIPVNSIEDYKAEESALSDMIAITKDIHKYHKVNVILIAHIIQKESKTPEGKTHMARVIVTAGKAIAQKIPAYCTEVYHFNIKTAFQASKGGQYALLTTHTGDDFARTSLNLDDEIVFGNEPLYDKWIKPAIDEYNQHPITYTTIPPQTNKPNFQQTNK